MRFGAVAVARAVCRNAFGRKKAIGADICFCALKNSNYHA
jgi:hypothetical protein